MIKNSVRFFSVLCLVLCSCRTVQPPQRPVAYMYPSVMPMSALDGLSGRHVTRQFVKFSLQRNGLLVYLTQAGMQDMDLEIVARGLSARGYGEIYARNSNCIVRWVSVSFPKDGSTIITAGFEDFPPELCRFSIDVAKNAAEKSQRKDTYGRIYDVSSWQIDLPDGNFSLRHVTRRQHSSWETQVVIAPEKQT